MQRLFSQHYPAMHVASATLPTVVGNIVSTSVRWWNQLVISDINNNSARAILTRFIIHSSLTAKTNCAARPVAWCMCVGLFLCHDISLVWGMFSPVPRWCTLVCVDVSALRSTIFLPSNYKWVRFFRVVFRPVHPSSYPVSVPFCCAQRVTTVGLNGPDCAGTCINSHGNRSGKTIHFSSFCLAKLNNQKIYVFCNEVWQAVAANIKRNLTEWFRRNISIVCANTAKTIVVFGEKMSNKIKFILNTSGK